MCSKQGCKTERKPLVCKWCSVVFVPQGRGPQKFCSAECSQSNKASVAAEINSQRFAMLPKCATDHCQAKVWQSGQTHCKVCLKRIQRTGSVDKWLPCTRCGERYSKTKSRKGTLCVACKNAAQVKERPTRECEVCGKSFKRVRRNKDVVRACSRECGFNLIAIDRTARFAGRRLQRANAAASRLVGSLKSCTICKWHFVANRGQHTCSDICRKKLNRRNANLLYEERKTPKPCADCGGDTFRPKYCKACSNVRKAAAKSAARFVRRRLQTGVTSPDASRAIRKGISDMIRKASNKCSLCGLMMTKGCDPNHDRYIELDHKVPLSRGGTDTFDNLQAVCRKCNGLKSAFTSVDVVLAPSLDDAQHITNS